MLEHYVFCSLALTLSYWVGRPAFAVLLPIALNLAWTGLFEFSDGATSADIRELCLYLPLSALFGAIVGGGLSLIIHKPPPPWQLDTCRRWTYLTVCLALLLVWIGSLLCWQLVAQVWWNYWFLGLMLQFAVLLASYLFVGHEAAWNSPVGSRESVVVHWHFFVVSIIILDVTFCVGQSFFASSWPFYLSTAFFCSASLYAIAVNTCRPVRVVAFLPAIAEAPQAAPSFAPLT